MQLDTSTEREEATAKAVFCNSSTFAGHVTENARKLNSFVKKQNEQIKITDEQNQFATLNL
eukprot:1263870-Amphidinium_carterae.1